MASDTIEVLVAESDRLVRAGLRVLLEADGDITVVGEVGRGEHAVTGARQLRPDVVLIDAGVAGFGALAATRLIFETGLAQVGVLLLTPTATDAEVFAAFHAGAHGVLGRDSRPADLLRAVRVIGGGGALVTPLVTRRLANEVVSRRLRGGAARAELQALTDREREVLALLGLGFSTGEIAARLAVSQATVKSHVGHLMGKLRARDRAELVMLAYETGLVLPVGQAAELDARPLH